MTQQEQRRKAIGQMTSLVLSHHQPLGFMVDGKHAGVWLSEEAKDEYDKLNQLVTEIDEGKG